MILFLRKQGLARAGLLLSALLFCTPISALSQSNTMLAVLPTDGLQLENATRDQLSASLAGFLRARYNLRSLDMPAVRDFYNANQPADSLSVDDLKAIADELGVNMLAIPQITYGAQGKVYKVSLFDAVIEAITKTAAQPCQCDASDMLSFPFRRVSELLFDSPDGLLTEEDRDAPPEISIALPDIPFGSDSAETQDDSRRKKGRPWLRYAAGAVVVSGGLLYLSARGDSNPGGTNRIADPPNPPSGN